MSGGSYNYLYSWAETATVADDIHRTGERLQELGHTDAASSTLEILRLAESLRDVWRAVEWADSGDWDVADIREAVAEYRTKHDKLTDEGAKLAREGLEK